MDMFVGRLLRVAIVCLRATRTAVCWSFALARKPGWQGWGTILTFFSILATSAVAWILFEFAQQEEERSREESRAHFYASGWLSGDVGEPWLVELTLTNGGPAVAGPVRIDLWVGSSGFMLSRRREPPRVP